MYQNIKKEHFTNFNLKLLKMNITGYQTLMIIMLKVIKNERTFTNKYFEKKN